jgi:predicted permease
MGRLRAADREAFLRQQPTALAAGAGGGARGMREHLTPLRILAVLSLAVLLVGCANIATLLLSRMAARTAEIGARLALGATRARLVRQLLAESLLLSAAGAALGVLIASWAQPVLARVLLGDDPPPGLELRVESRLVLFTLAASMVTAVLCGIAPALRVTRADALQALMRRTPLARDPIRTRAAAVLAMCQVAACVVLLGGAALLLRTLANLQAVERGFQADQLLLVEVGTPAAPLEGARIAAYYADLIGRAATAPGVAAASVAARPLIGRGDWKGPVWVRGFPPDEEQTASFNVIGPGFLETTGTRLLAGREFSLQDGPGAAAVAIVNETFAARYCAGQGSALDCRFGDRGPSSSGTYEVIGVAQDVKYDNLRERPAPMVYYPILQERFPSPVTLHVRTRGRSAAIASALLSTVRAADTTVPLSDPRTGTEQLDRTLRQERFMAALAMFFASVATLLTGIGLFGSIASAVKRRTREIGVRIALGARPADVVRATVGRTLMLVAAGAAAGLAIAAAAARVLTALLFDISPTDPQALAGAVLLLLAVAAAATYIPARRAARLDPMAALRHE